MNKRPKNNDRAMLDCIHGRKYMVLFNVEAGLYAYVRESSLNAMVRNAGNDKFYVVRAATDGVDDEYGRKARGAILGRRIKLTGEFELIWGAPGENKPTAETAVNRHIFNPAKKDIASIINVFDCCAAYRDEWRMVKPGLF